MSRGQRWGVAALAVVVSAAVGSRSLLPAQGPAASKPDVGSTFAGVVLAQYEDGTVFRLEKASIRRVEAKAFLVGLRVGEGAEKDPFDGVKCWVPLDKVAIIYEFKSAEGARKAFP